MHPTFEIVQESPFPVQAELLRTALPALYRELVRVLGSPRDQELVIFVVLSDRRSHTGRWPVRQSEVASLISEEDPDSARYAMSSYAHGVASRGRPGLKLPKVPDGAAVICLDIETIHQLAQEAQLPPGASLLRVAAHELAHIARGHCSTTTGATHGWYKEGDAQRDAWQVLALLLGNPEWEALARAGRRMQVHLAASQPPAYQQFGQLAPDRRDLTPTDERRHWVLGADGPLHLGLSRPVHERPLLPGEATPSVGDHIWIDSEFGVFGPMQVLGREDHHLASENKGRTLPPGARWLHMAPAGPIRWSPEGALGTEPGRLRPAGAAETAAFDHYPDSDASTLAFKLRELRRAHLELGRRGVRESFAGRQMPEATRAWLESAVDPDS